MTPALRTPILGVGALLAAALSLTACQKADDAVFGQRVHAYLMAHPEVIRETAEKLAENERRYDAATYRGSRRKAPRFS